MQRFLARIVVPPFLFLFPCLSFAFRTSGLILHFAVLIVLNCLSGHGVFYVSHRDPIRFLLAPNRSPASSPPIPRNEISFFSLECLEAVLSRSAGRPEIKLLPVMAWPSMTRSLLQCRFSPRHAGSIFSTFCPLIYLSIRRAALRLFG